MKTKIMELDLLWLILAVLVGAYVFLFGFLRKLNEWYYFLRLGKKKNYLPPGDMGWPIIGNMLSFIRAFTSQDPDSFINNLVNRYGETKIYRTNLFWQPSIIVCSPEFCKRVLTDDERFILDYPSPVIKLLGKKSFHFAPNVEHKRLRRIITAPLNGNETMSMYIGNIEDIVISSLQKWATKNSPIEFLNEFRLISLKVMANILMGSTNIVSDSMTKHYHDFFQGFTALEINVPGFTFHRALQARKTLVNLLQPHVNQRRSRKSDETNKEGMIDLFVEVKDDKGEKLDDEEIVNLLLGFFLGGFGNTTLVATWLTIYLHDNPKTLQKAKEEQEEIMKRRPSSQKGLTLNEIRQMKYLSKVIDETLRRCNIIPFTHRKAKVDIEIDGYIIPKGWKVLPWKRSVHMDPETYSNPKEFLPSRWDNHKSKPGSFIPFGAGSRICPGADLSELQISIFFHHFLLNYSFEQINPRGPIRHLPTPSPIDNCLAKITKLPRP